VIKRAAFIALMWLFFAMGVFAQSTVVSGVITDSSSQVWFGGSYQFTFYPAPSNPSGAYFWNGAPFNTSQVFKGALNSSGAFSVSIPANSSITPSGSQWSVQVCSAASANCYTTTLTITGATMNISSLVVPPPITVNAAGISQLSAYQDSQITNASLGTTYFNLTTGTVRLCTVQIPCTWVPIAGGGGAGNPAAPGAALQFANSSVTSFATVQCGGSYLGIDNVTSPTTLIDPCIFQQDANAIFAGPNPYIDITAPPYNARGVTINTTGSGSGNSLTVAVNTFHNNDWITVVGGGSAPTMPTPSAPTVQPGEAESEQTPDAFMTSTTLGSSCYNYRFFAEDILGGVTAASPVTTNCNGPATLGQVSISLSALSLTGRTLSFTSTTPHGLAQYALAHITAGSNSYYLSGWPIIQTITDSTHAGDTENVMNSGTATVSATSATLVYFTGNSVTLPVVTGALHYWVCVERPGDVSYSIIGTPLPKTTRFVDFGATLSSNPVIPWYISNANCTASSAQPEYALRQVLTGGGSTSLGLSVALTTPVSGAAVRLDNLVPITNAIAAAVANPSAAAGIYIPVGTFPINSTPIGLGGTGILQAGNLVINSTILPLSGTRWSGGAYKGTTSGNLPPFANDSPPLITCNANPCIDMSYVSGYPFFIENLAIFGPSNGNGVLMVASPQFTSKFFNLQFQTGDNANDNMGIALYEPPGTSFPFECDWCTFAGGPGQVVDQTWAPLVLLEGNSATGASGIILKGGNFNRRGIFSKSTDGGGNQVYIDSTYRQGGITPLVAFEGNNGNATPTLYLNHVHVDTEQQALVAMWGDAGANMFLTYYLGVENGPQNDGGGDPSSVTGSGSQSAECVGERLDDAGPNGQFLTCTGWVFDQQNLNATNPITAPGEIAANAGVFTNTQMNLPYSFAVGGVNFLTEFQAAFGSNYLTSGAVSGVGVPSGSTVNLASGFAGFCNNASATTPCTAGYFQGRATANNTKVWGLNPVCQDTVSLTGVTCDGEEIDVNIFSASTSGQGLLLNGVFAAQPSSFPAVHIAKPSPDQWTLGIQIDTAATTTGTAMYIFPQAAGASEPSQIITFQGNNASSVPELATVGADPNGNLDLNPSGGTVNVGNGSGAISTSNVDSSIYFLNTYSPNTQQLTAASITSAGSTVTCSSCTFTAADVGKAITLGIHSVGPSSGGLPLVSTISGFTSSTVVTIAATAGTTNLTGNNIVWGAPASTAINARIAAISAAGGGKLVVPCGYSYIDATIQTYPNVDIEAVGPAGEGSASQDCATWFLAGNVTTGVQVGIGTTTQFQAPRIKNLSVDDRFSQATNLFLVNGASNGVFDGTMARGCNATGAACYKWTFGGGSTQASTWAMNDARAYDCTTCVDASLVNVDGPQIGGGEFVVKNTNTSFTGQPIGVIGSAVRMNKGTHVIVGQNAGATQDAIGVECVNAGSAFHVEAKMEAQTVGHGIGIQFGATCSRGTSYSTVQGMATGANFVSGTHDNYLILIDSGGNNTTLYTDAGARDTICTQLGCNFERLNQVAANSYAGTATLAGGTVTVTFPSPGYNSAPVCTASDTTSAAAIKTATTATTLIVTGTGTDTVAYICAGNPN
jgi:hypothetical protein